MRIISGKLKGRRFDLPSSKWKTRPTTDQSKESLFNILGNKTDVYDSTVLDLFAGTGNLGYEFASRGAASVVCVEKYAPATKFIQQKAKDFGLDDQIVVHRTDVFQFLKNAVGQYDIIFADPPYNSSQYPQLINILFEKELLRPDGWLIVEHDSQHKFEQHERFVEQRQYGQSHFSFFR